MRRAFALLSLTGCCHFGQTIDTAPARPIADESGGAVLVKTDLELCSGAVVRATRVGEDGWEHDVLTARHCFGDWTAEVPAAAVRVRVDGGYEGYLGRLAAWGSERRRRGLGVTTILGRSTVFWTDDDWAVVKVRTPMRLGVIPLGSDADTLREGDPVVVPSYLDIQTSTELVPHEHRFLWGAVPPELPQDGHSGAPVVKDGKLVALFVESETNSLFCRALSAVDHHALGFVRVSAIRAGALRQGVVLD